MSTRRDPPPCTSAIAWLKHHKGKHCFAPFTGQDHAALSVFVHAAALYGRADMAGEQGALEAMRGAARAMQPQLRHMARDVIPAMLDWSSIAEVWPKVTSEVPVVDEQSPSAHRDELRSWAARQEGTTP